MKKNYSDYANIMKALSDETRVKIFDMLSNGELCACDILEEFHITQPTLSYHMKILRDSDLIHSRREGTWTKYSINKDTLKNVQMLFQRISENINDKEINIKGE